MIGADLADLGVITKLNRPVDYTASLSNAIAAPLAAAPLIQMDLSPATTASLTLTGNTAVWVFEAVKKLEALGRLRRGWDSYDGLPVSPIAKKMTFDALGWLKGQDLPIPAVVLGSAGTVHLEWRYTGRELELGLGEGEAVEYVKVDNHGGIEEGEEREQIQDRLRTLAEWLRNG